MNIERTKEGRGNRIDLSTKPNVHCIQIHFSRGDLPWSMYIPSRRLKLKRERETLSIVTYSSPVEGSNNIYFISGFDGKWIRLTHLLLTFILLLSVYIHHCRFILFGYLSTLAIALLMHDLGTFSSAAR